MENFAFAYTHRIEDYFNPKFESYYDFEDGHFDGIDFSSSINIGYDECLSVIENFRSIIKRDMQDIIATRIDGLNNNGCLISELNTVIDTIDNGIDFDFTHGENFAFRTDNFLCFNNFENYVDELEWGSLGEDACSRETIVIIDCNLRSFYFIRTKRKLSCEVESTTINAYQVKGKNVKKRKVNFKNGLSFTERTDEGIQKMLSLVS